MKGNLSPFHGRSQKNTKSMSVVVTHYQDALRQVDLFIDSTEHPESGVQALRKEQSLLKSIASAILFNGQQCIAF